MEASILFKTNSVALKNYRTQMDKYIVKMNFCFDLKIVLLMLDEIIFSPFTGLRKTILRICRI